VKATVLILTAGFGEGHNAAARALAAACDEARGKGTARIVDVFAEASPRWNALLRKSYLTLINRLPSVWSMAYGWLDRSPSTPRLLQFLKGEQRVLARILAEETPTVVCSTYPVYGFMFEAGARRGVVVPPHAVVVTDSISINSLWWRGRCDQWFLPNRDSAEVLKQAGVPPDRLQVLGFPVNPVFADTRDVPLRPDLQVGARPRVLYIINSRTRHALETARSLLRHSDWEVTCAVGRNEALQAELSTLALRRSAPTRILGWTDEIPRLLRSHHVLISKAGGATTQEALAAGCPMIVNEIVPGQEEGNYELLRRHGIGAFAGTPERVLAELARAFAGGGGVWWQWRRAVETLSRPFAAREIAGQLLAMAGTVRTPPCVSPDISESGSAVPSVGGRDAH
jgi:processive 1,2-diacylglycerol beta-glucosyltransferase